MRTLVLTALVVVALLATLSVAQDDDAASIITWRTDLAAARAEAAAKGRPLMVVFR